MEREVEIITINDTDYMIMKEAEHNGITYIFLSNPNDPADIMIRKNSKENEDEYGPLENEEEFNIACLALFKDI